MQRCAVADEVKWEKGCVSGAVYWGDESLTNLLVKVCIFFHVSTHTNIQLLTFFELATVVSSVFLF